MANEILEDTVQGLWRTLLRIVPAARRPDAEALANALHYFVERSGYEAGRADERRRWEEREQLAAAHLQGMPCPSDAPRTWKDESRGIRVLEKTDTAH